MESKTRRCPIRAKLLASVLATMMLAMTLLPSVSVAAIGTGVSGIMSNTQLPAGKGGRIYKHPHIAGRNMTQFRIMYGGKYYPGFCIRANARAESGDSYLAAGTQSAGWTRLSKAKQDMLSKVLYYGWQPNKLDPRGHGNTNDLYIATQVLIWDIEQGFRSNLLPAAPPNETNYKFIKGTEAAWCYYDILCEIRDYAKGASFTYPTEQKAKSAGAKLMKHSYTSGNKDRWDLTLTDTIKFKPLRLVKAGTGNTVTIPKSPSWDYKVSRTSATTGTSIAFASSAASGTSQSLLIWNRNGSQPIAMGAPATDSTEFYGFVRTEQPGTGKIVKTVTDGRTVKGFKFKITGIKGTSTAGYDSGWKTTNASGEIEAKLYPGQYMVEEDAADAVGKSYKVPEKPKKITITEGKTTTVTFKNIRNQPGFTINKATDDGGTVAGFKFNVHSTIEAGKPLTEADVIKKSKASGSGKLTVDATSLAELNKAIAAGKTGNYKVTIMGNAGGVAITVHLHTLGDTKTNPPVVNKGNGITANNIDYAGAAKVFDKNYVTDKDGVIAAKLPDGTYKVTEVMTPEQAGRYRQPKPQTIKLSPKNQNVSLYFENHAKEGGLEIKKTSDDGRIAGIPFRIDGTTATGKAITPFFAETDARGIIADKAKGLLPGKYTITEQPIKGVAKDYYLPQAPQTVIVKDGGTASVHFHNKVAPVDQPVVKKSAHTGEALSGAKMQILSADGKKVIDEWESTTEPHLVKNLERGGKYILHEVSPPPGYELAEDIPFVCAEQELVEMTDIQTNVTVEKRDKSTQEYLAGCTIDIVDDETGQTVESVTTTEDAVTVNLIGGKTYRLHEATAPEGYELTDDVAFSAENGKTVALFDEKTPPPEEETPPPEKPTPPPEEPTPPPEKRTPPPEKPTPPPEKPTPPPEKPTPPPEKPTPPPKKPKVTKAPKTGDDFGLEGAVLVLGLSGLAIGVGVILRRRFNNQ